MRWGGPTLTLPSRFGKPREGAASGRGRMWRGLVDRVCQRCPPSLLILNTRAVHSR